MKPVRLSKEELKAQFRTGERFAVRIAALQRKSLFLTEAVLEEALRRPEVMDFLLGEPILAGQADLPAKAGLTLVSIPEGRLIALAEELLGEEPPNQLQKTEAPATFEFSREQLEQLRMTVFTSVDPKQKIETLRKLAFSRVPADEKGVIFLRALNDSDSDVRREAVSALQNVGLNPEAAEALRALGEGSAGQKKLAMERLASRLPNCAPAERAVLFSAIVSQIRQEPDVDVMRGLIDFLGKLGDVVQANPELRILLVRTAVKILTDHYVGLSQPVLRLFEQLAPGAGEDAAAAVWKEIEPLSDRRLKALFLSVIGKFPLGSELRRTLSAAIARTLSVTHGEEIESRQFLEAGRMLGEEQVRAYLQVLPEVKDDYLGHFIFAVDFSANSSAIGEETLNETGRAFLHLLDTKGKVVRRAILESSLCHHPRLAADIKDRIALHFLSNLHLDHTGRMAELTSALVGQMGLAAMPALQEVVLHSPHEAEKRAALDLIGAIGASGPQEPGPLAEMVRFLRKAAKNAAVPAGALWINLGRVCANPGVEASLSADVFEDFRAALKKKKAGYDLVIGLGHLAASPGTPVKETCNVVLDMLQTLEGKMPDPSFRQQKTEDGIRLVIGSEALAYTEFIPNLLSAITMIYESGKLPDTLRSRVIDRLVGRWDDLIEFREIWAPGTVIDLARAFCALARHPSTDPVQRAQMYEAILRYCRNTTICRILADGLRATDEDSDANAEINARFVEALMELHRHPDYQQADDRRAVLASLGRTALNRRLAKSKKESERVREQIVELLIEQSGPGQREILRLLREIAGSPHVGAALKSRVQTVVEA